MVHFLLRFYFGKEIIFTDNVSVFVIFYRYRYILVETYRYIMKYVDTDINELLYKKIQEKKRKLDEHRPIPKDTLAKILEDIRLRHTYHSDAIEGNTLTLLETKVVLEEGVTIRGKSLKDHIEAKDDAEAFDLMIELAQKKRYKEMEKKYSLTSCIKCGSCEYICPTKRPLMDSIFLGFKELKGGNKDV